jgi:hypothetical protein
MSANTADSELQLASEGRVAKLLIVSRGCLRNWRATGEGPPWFRLGDKLIRYDVSALRRWIEDQAKARDGH